MPRSSKIFANYKALGYVSNDVPLVTRYIRRRKENLVVTSVGRAFHTYGCAHFALLSVSGQHPEEIQCLAADTFHIYTAAGNDVYAWRRGSELKHKYVGHKKPVHCILPFGPHLITVDEDNKLMVWDIKSEETFLEMKFSATDFEITSLVHPSTYLNKIVLGSEQGSLHLFNIKSQSVIYTFKGWNSGVKVLVQSPALDVIGIGLTSGDIVLHNLKFDETLMNFHQDWGVVTSLSFRTDSPIMVSGAANGRIVVWDLENRKVFSQLVHAHSAAVTGLQCLPNEPLMVSSSADNSLKLWIFDMADGGPRLLRLREGHSAPPTFIRFHGANGQNLLSSGGDSCLRIFNIVTETFNKSLGRASYNRKISKKKGKIPDDPLIMPPIVKFTSEVTREKEWDSIAAIHLGIPIATTWSYGRLKMGELKLAHGRFREKQAGTKLVRAVPSSLVLTHCGNFVVLGYSSGHCDRFNIQSGIHRATYGDPAHKGAVRGVAVNNLNQAVLTGGGDAVLKWWHFTKQNMIGTLSLHSGVSFFCHHGESEVLAVALDDSSIVLVDGGERSVIRHFDGHAGRLTDAAFSPDARWLITSGMDCEIRTWDVPSGCLVDRFKVASACTSLTFSPTGELLATTHVDYLGVYLWFNKTLYTHTTLRPIDLSADVPLVALPSGEREEEAPNEEDEEEKDEITDQIGDLATLSGLPASRWLNLLNIEVVRRRNRPKEPPRAPAAAPFFLPTIPALNLTFDLSSAANKPEESLSQDLFTTTPFGQLLKATAGSHDYSALLTKLKSMGPSAINFEINALSSSDELALQQFLEMVKEMLNSKKDFELAQAYLGLFLKVHGPAIIQSDSLSNLLPVVLENQAIGWGRLESKLFYNLAVIQALKNI